MGWRGAEALAGAGRRAVSVVALVAFLGGVAPLLADEADCLRCHDETKAWFKRKVVHKPFKARNCGACHEFHKFEQKLVLKREGQALCLECHADIKSSLSGRVHPPVDEGRCWACHDPHSSDQKHLLRDSESGSPCFACHEGIQFDLYAENPHKPFYERQCVSCHAPHSSTIDYFLKLPPHVLCSSCHDWAVAREKHLPFFDVPTRCTVCHRAHGSASANLIDPQIHPPVLDGCPTCHEPVVGGKTPEFSVPVAELCASCHDVLAGVTHAHPPAAEGQCTTCHDPHRSPNPALLKRHIASVCAECHESDALPETGSVHRPYADSECARCHSAHGGAFAGLQTAATPDLCYECHRDMKLLVDSAAVIHPPVESEGCPQCHRPHVSESPSLLTGSLTEICGGCHESGVDQASVHKPYGTGVCTACHQPHAGGAGLLKAPGNQLCFGCHKEFSDLTDTTVAHPAVLDGCVKCHGSHQTPYASLLTRPQRELCEGCHGNPEQKVPDHPPVEVACSDCHNPHRR